MNEVASSKKNNSGRIISIIEKIKSLNGLLTILLTTVIGLYLFVAGPNNTEQYAIDKNNGWVYYRSTYFSPSFKNPTLKLSQESLLDSAEFKEGAFAIVGVHSINLRARPSGALKPDMLGPLAPNIITSLQRNECVRINAIAITGWQSVWVHVTKGLRQKKCGEE